MPWKVLLQKFAWYEEQLEWWVEWEMSLCLYRNQEEPIPTNKNVTYTSIKFLYCILCGRIIDLP